MRTLSSFAIFDDAGESGDMYWGLSIDRFRKTQESYEELIGTWNTLFQVRRNQCDENEIQSI